jgi:hypothetical protein
VRAEFRRGAGAQFDPALVKEFLLVLDSGDPAFHILADAVCGPGHSGASASPGVRPAEGTGGAEAIQGATR